MLSGTNDALSERSVVTQKSKSTGISWYDDRSVLLLEACAFHDPAGEVVLR